MTDTVRQYALAVFSLALEKDEVLSFQKNFQLFLYQLDDESQLFFVHPGFSKPEKRAFVIKLKLSSLLQNFLFLLIDNDRFDMIQEIYDMYSILVLEQNQLLEVVVKSRSKLSEQQLSRIKNKLEQDYKRTVHLTEKMDQKIIAGYILEFEGFSIDDTVSRRMNDLVLNLKKN